MPRHLFFRLLLKLYPKSFCEHYGEEMLQVYDDLLAEQSGVFKRISVSFRVMSELPLSILQENNNTIGALIMKHNLYQKNKKLIIGSCILLILIALPFGVVWSRRNVLPGMTGMFVKNDIQEISKRQYSELGSPMSQFDGNNIEKSFSCRLDAYQGIHSQIGCSDSSEKIIELSQGESKKATVAKAKEIEDKLLESGYIAGTNGVTFSGQVTGTYEGVDYSPDAFYQKVVDNAYHCLFSSYIAYSNPDKPKIRIVMSCSKTVNILGRPSNTIHESSQNYELQ